ncbi:MAG: glycerol-3-phosphate 1-O-acyltransferase PlsY [Mariprofundaceae bacterium]
MLQPAAVLAAYLLGAVPFGLLLSRLISKRDPRQHGSGNIGATNALRTGGKLVGALTLLTDVAKGAVPVALAVNVGWADQWVAAIAVGAALGHVFPVYLKFKGGKGVATMFGAVLPWLPWAALAALAVWLLSLKITHYVSLSSILAGCALPIAAWAAGASPPAIAASFFFAVLMTLRHASNIRRLLDGTEPSTLDDRKAREASELRRE